MNYYPNDFEEDSPVLESPRIDQLSRPAIVRYVNILADKWFREILGAEANKDALIALLRELIPEREIADISYGKKPKRKHNPYVDGHDAGFDVECTDQDGTRFVVEMQVEEQVHFRERALFYATFPVQEQVLAQRKGMAYRSHDEQYLYPPVYVISFLNFSLHDGEDRVLYRYDLREQQSGELMTDRLNFLFLEMTNYRKEEPEASDSFAEKLSYALTHMKMLEERPAALVEEVFGLLFAACEISRLDEQQKLQYQDDMTTEMDKLNIQYTRDLRAREEGRKEVARRMLADSLPIETIAKYSGLTKEQIEALR